MGASEMWLNKFSDKQQEILEQIEELREKQRIDPRIAELIAAKQEELKCQKEYIYQYLINIGENKTNYNVILKFVDRGIEETIHNQLGSIIKRLKQKGGLEARILRSDVGEVTLSDIEEAQTFKAEIFTFGVHLSNEVLISRKQFSVKPKVHKLIHTFLKDFQESGYNRKKVSIKGIEKGRGLVAEVFKITKGKKQSQQTLNVPGIRVTGGKISKSAKIYVFRDGVPISDGMNIKSLKSFKKELGEVKKGDECTVTLNTDGEGILQKGDELVAYEE